MSFIKSILRRTVTAAAAFVLAVNVPAIPAPAALLNDETDEEPLFSDSVSAAGYGSFYDEHISDARPDREITVNGADYTAASGGDFSTGTYGGEDVSEERDYAKDNVLIWNSDEGSVTYTVNIGEAGLYSLYMWYYPIVCNATTIELRLLVDGELQYDTASRLALARVWKDEHPVTRDKRDNEIRPSQVQQGAWCEQAFYDVDGLFSDPLLFLFDSVGEHTITLEGVKANIAIDKFKLYNRVKPAAYIAPAPSESEATPSALLRFEGEAAAYKSHATLYATNERSNSLISPSDPVKMRYNTIGEGNWDKNGQIITWKIHVENDGWYKLGIKAKQNEMRGFYSNRRIYIDGQVLCSELDRIKFPYDNSWQLISPQTADGEEVYVYLTTVSYHELSMEAVPGEIGGYMRRLDDIVRELNLYYRRILMITSPKPDKYTSYNVDKKIPDLISAFERLSRELDEVQSGIEALSGVEGSEAAALERMTIILDKCVKRPNRIPEYLKTIKDNITALSAWMRDYRDQPLEVDYIELASADRDFSRVEEGFFEGLIFQIKAFFYSFFEDYNILSEDGDEEALDVWVALARDQAQVVKALVDSDFVPKYDINVNINLVQGGIVEASLTGKGPDIALFTGGEFPVNLAARGLLLDLKQFDDYDEVMTRFLPDAATMYEYSGGCYALPITQSFPMMFYRTDILSELGFDRPPETWQDIIDMLPALQRNYMGVGLVLPTINVSAATEVGHMFAMLLMQQDIDYYNTELTATNFKSAKAIDAFKTWTDFYTEYKFSQTYDAFSYFRTGEYPIVIQNYSFFNQLSVAAPEIKGLWDFTVVPGTQRADGTVSHAANSVGAGAIVFDKVKNPDDAWTFLKWFTSDEVMAQYGQDIEGLMGQMGRFESANSNALSSLSWTSSELKRINAQRSQLREIPIIPASYVVTRNIVNAFRTTVNEAENPRDTLLWYNREIDAEITRKRRNLGLN